MNFSFNNTDGDHTVSILIRPLTSLIWLSITLIVLDFNFCSNEKYANSKVNRFRPGIFYKERIWTNVFHNHRLLLETVATLPAQSNFSLSGIFCLFGRNRILKSSCDNHRELVLFVPCPTLS